MGRIVLMKNRDLETTDRLLYIWQSSVKATHTFLSDSDIEAIIPEVGQGIEQIEALYCFIDAAGSIQGFIGVEDEKIEMLFVNAGSRGTGIGRALINFAFEQDNAKYVDVNEQNEQGRGFYAHLGFRATGRSEVDSQGRPFPILHLQR